jgi:hypothetical protein
MIWPTSGGVRATSAGLLLVLSLGASACGASDEQLAYGTRVDATQFRTEATWTRFAVPNLVGVSVELPASPDQSGGFGNDYYVVKDASGCRRATVGVSDPHDRLSDEEHLVARCAEDAESTDWRAVDGRRVCVVTHPVAEIDRAAAARGEPACRLHTLFAIAQDLVVSVAYSTPLDAPETESAVRERLFRSLRLNDPSAVPHSPAE